MARERFLDRGAQKSKVVSTPGGLCNPFIEMSDKKTEEFRT